MSEKNKNLVQNMTEVKVIEFDDKVFIQGNGKAKMLGVINTDRRVTFNVSDDGTITRIKRPLDFIFKYPTNIAEVEVAE